MVSRNPSTSELGRDHPITVGRPFKRDTRDCISHFYFSCLCFSPAISAITIKGRTREGGHLACDGQILRPARRSFLHMLPDKLKHPTPPVAFLYRACSSSDAKTFFKKSFSMVKRPTIRSSSEMRASSVYALPFPANARSLYFLCRCLRFEIVLAVT